MAKLHQLLAVEPDIKKKEEKIRKETINTFKNKSGHYEGIIQKFLPYDENESDVTENEKLIVDTVNKKLQYTQDSIVKLLDFTIQKELANQKAKADVIIEGETESQDVTLLEDIPATMLLGLESRLKEIRSIYLEIPTCDPSRKWEKDPNEDDVYNSSKELKFRTKKDQQPIVLYDATDKHPAQTQLITKDIEIGKIETMHRTSKLTPAEKSKLLDKIDILLLAVKKARQRANDQEIETRKIGKKIFNFIHG